MVKELSRYIHLNPVKAKIVERPEEYEWSSYRYYLNSKGKPDFLETDFILGCFDGDKNKYKKFVEMGMIEKVRDVLKEVRGGTILGDEEFIEEIKERYLKGRKDSEDLPGLKAFKKEYKSQREIDRVIKREVKGEEQKKIQTYLYKKYTDLSNSKIIESTYKKRMHSSAVSKIVSRIDKKRQDDRTYDKRLNKIEGNVNVKV